MIIKIKPVSEEPGSLEYVFEATAYEVRRKKYEHPREVGVYDEQSGVVEIYGLPNEAKATSEVQVTSLTLQMPSENKVIRLQGQVTVFVVNDKGHTVDRINN